MKTIKINGRTRYFNRLESLSPDNAGRYTATTIAGYVFTIVGGKAAGGSSKDWFLSCDNQNIINGCMDCKSLVDALNIIEAI